MMTSEARMGAYLVVETDSDVSLGRFDGRIGDSILLRDAVRQSFQKGVDREWTIQETIRHLQPPEHEFLAISTASARRIRRLDELAFG